MSSLRLDWKALSVEVQPDSFSPALTGMIAMGFHGVRLFDEYQSRVVESFAGDDPVPPFVGNATSGSVTGGRWNLWDNLGFAWIDLLGRRSPYKPPVIWLHGNSRTTRSVFAALVANQAADLSDEIQIASHKPTPNWLWTAAPELTGLGDWLSGLSEWLAEARVASDVTEANGHRYLSWFSEGVTISEENKVVASCANLPLADTIVGFVSEHSVLPVQIGDWLAETPVNLVVSQNTVLPDSCSGLAVAQISPSELFVAGEAYDFQRWTGFEVDIQMLQDAYDEYCDF